MTDAPTVQATQGTAVPIQALAMPPEGQRGIQQTYTFSPGGLLMAGAVLQLNQPGGLALSQVVSLCIDNTQNPNSVTVTHGVFNETITVQAGGFQVVPTFSTKSTYNVLLTLPASPLQNVPVSIIFLNYNRQQYNIQSGGSQVSNNVNTQTATAQINCPQLTLQSGQELVPAVEGVYYIITEFDILAIALSNSASYAVILSLAAGTGGGEFFVPVKTFWQGQFGCEFTTYPNVGNFQVANKQSIEYVGGVGQALGISAGVAGGFGSAAPIISVNFSYVAVNVTQPS